MADQEKPACKYGTDCYQRNQAHKDRFSHPAKDAPTSQSPPAKRRKSSSEDDDKSERQDDIEEQVESDHKANPNGNLSPAQPNTDSIQEDSKTEHDPKPIEIDPKPIEAQSSEAAGIRCSEFITERFDKGPHAQRAEYHHLLESPAEFISSKFLVEMPSDFFKFWEFCKAESKSNSNPENVFHKFGLKLAGPFDVLAKKFDDVEPFEPGEYLRHWRFYYDPPEFQTIFVKEKSGIHYGYWRDEPNGECFIARNDAIKNCEFTFVADNIFGAILHYLEEDVQTSPFNRQVSNAMKKSIEDFATSNDISLKTFAAKLKARNVKTVCKTFHKAGLAVPYNRKTDVGYRQLGESDANLKKILNKFTHAKDDQDLLISAMDSLQPLITAANIACDESDFGTAIELGIDLFCFGEPELHSVILQLLATGYKMVNKPQFIAIMKAHLAKRTKGYAGLSILDSLKNADKTPTARS